MFSCIFFEISKNTFFHRTPLVAASEHISFAENFNNISIENKNFTESIAKKNTEKAILEQLQNDPILNCLVKLQK